jgi:PAS domain S-box-containing protein
VERGALQATALASLSRRLLVVDDLSELLRDAAMSAVRALNADCVTVHALGASRHGWTVVGDDVVLRGRGFHSTVSSQVRPNGRVWGVVSAFARRPDAFDLQDELVMESVANLLAGAIDRKSAGDAERTLRTRELTFSEMFMGNPLPMWLYELDTGRLLEVNAAVTEKYGYSREQLMAMRVQDIGAPEDRDRLEEFVTTLRRNGSAYSDSDLWIHRRCDGTTMEVNLYSHRVHHRGHDAALMIAYDLTARRQADSALRESEERLRTLVVNAPVVLFALDRQGRLISAEGRALRALGLHTADLVGRSAFSVYPDHAQVRSVLTRALQGEEFSTVVEIGEVTLEGSFRPLFDEDGTVREVIGVATDISERVRAESELRRRITDLRLADQERRRLLGHLVTAQEEERRRVASEVHDEALPTLAAAIMLVGQLSEQRPGRREAQTLRSIDDALGAAVHQLRSLIGGLRPPGLDHGRLVPAMRHLARSILPDGVAVTVTGDLSSEPRGTAREMLYRIAQEALANCRAHAGATRVTVDLAEVDGGVRVTIRDDGRGFDAGDIVETPAPGHLGIISMRERAELVGGRWRIESLPAVGTVLEYWIPSSSPAAGS